MDVFHKIAVRVVDRLDAERLKGKISPQRRDQILKEELAREGYADQSDLNDMKTTIAQAAAEIRAKREKRAS